jgi:hypothetical protein
MFEKQREGAMYSAEIIAKLRQSSCSVFIRKHEVHTANGRLICLKWAPVGFVKLVGWVALLSKRFAREPLVACLSEGA